MIEFKEHLKHEFYKEGCYHCNMLDINSEFIRKSGNLKLKRTNNGLRTYETPKE